MARKRKNRKKRNGLIILTLISVLIISGCFLFLKNQSFSQRKEWNLILVNQENEIPKNYELELIELSNGEKVDSRIYPHLQEMFDAMREDGVYPIVRAGYRTEEKLQELFDERVKAYINEGYNKKVAEKFTESWVALPGTSEHQLGLAVDINADKSKSSNDEVYEWLAENAQEYGFILRYPKEKEMITGTSYEPWHYRYVGKDAAQEIYESEVCLEEYLK